MSEDKVSRWHYVYVLKSLKDGKFYIGYTINLLERIKQHNSGMSPATKPRTPFTCIYAELCISEKDAKRREVYLKTTQGGRFLKIRLKDFLNAKNNEYAPVVEAKAP